MSRDPFDEFREMERLFRKLLRGASAGVFIRKSGGKTRIDIQVDVSDSTIRRLKRKYPNAEIRTGSKRGPKPAEAAVRRAKKSEKGKKRSEEVDPRKLALKRLEERKKEREDHEEEKG